MSVTAQHRKQAAASAKSFFNGSLPKKELTSCVDHIMKATTSIPAAGASICAIFYWRISLDIAGKKFTGNAGGLGSVGAGSTNGDVYLASGVSIQELQANTVSFQFNSAPVYLNVNFFDANSKYLGSFHGGGVGICIGTGGGTGSFS